MADGPGKAFSVPSYVSVGDPYPASNKDKYPLAQGKQFETPFPASQRAVVDGTINTTSYIAVGDPYLKPRAKIHGEMMNRPQMGGSQAARNNENTLNPTTYTTVDTPYQQGGYKPSKESYQNAKGKQFTTNPAQAAGTIDGTIGSIERTYITVGDPYRQGGHTPAKETYGLAMGKQMEMRGPKQGRPGAGAQDALLGVMGHITVGDPYDDALQSMPFKGAQDYTRNIQCERMRQTTRKDQRVKERVALPEYIAAQGLPTLSQRRESGGGRRSSAENEFHQQRERAKLLKKFPRYAKALSPDRLKPKHTPYIGPDAGPQLLGRKGPNSDGTALVYARHDGSPMPILSSPQQLRVEHRMQSHLPTSKSPTALSPLSTGSPTALNLSRRLTSGTTAAS